MPADSRAGGASPAEAASPRPARRRGTRSSPAGRALSPAGGRGRARTVPALRAGPLPAARGATAFVRPNWGGVSSITPAPARQRSWSAGRGRLASWLPGPGGAGAPRGGGAGGQGSRSRRSAARPPLLRGGSPLSAARGPPPPQGSRKAKVSWDGASRGALRCPAAPCLRAAPATSARLSGSLLRTPHRVN